MNRTRNLKMDFDDIRFWICVFTVRLGNPKKLI